MQAIFLAGAARIPIGRFQGKLATLSAPQLGAIAIREAVRRAGLAPEHVEGVIMGNVISAGVGQAPARQAALAAGMPPQANALTVNRVCASGLTAVILAAQALQTGEAEVMVAGGMESMSQTPHLIMGSRSGLRLGHGQLIDSMVHDGLWCASENHHMGNSAEAIAAKYGITRQQQDEFALMSHRRAAAAGANGGFAPELVPVEVRRGREVLVVDADEGPRPDTSLEALARLPSAFKEEGTVTAGNSSQISDGAAALVVLTEAAAGRLGARPMARIVAHVTVGNEPLWLFDAPVLAVRKLLEKTGERLEDYDLIECNEAFAAEILANGLVLGWDWSRVNIKGGAVALGHPIGASGARIMVTLLHGLEQGRLRRGLVVLCHGGGGAVAMSVERI